MPIGRAFVSTALYGLLLTQMPDKVNSLEVTTLGEETAGPNCTNNVTDNSAITLFYDEETQLVTFNVSVEDNSYVGFGWGSDMTDTEMISWVAKGDESSTTNYFAKEEGYPDPYSTIDPCYTNTWTVNSEAGTVDFVTTRPLDCGIADTYVVQLDVSMSLCAAW